MPATRCLWRTAARSQDGQALVEFALVLLPMLVVLFAIVQFGLALNSTNGQTHLANEVARYAIVNQNPTEGKETLQQWGFKQLYTVSENELNAQGEKELLTKGQVCISFPDPAGTEPGRPVKVTVRSTNNWLPILGLSATSTELEGVAYMRIEAAPTNYTAGCFPA